jgi:hypothetical protein
MFGQYKFYEHSSFTQQLLGTDNIKCGGEITG